MIPREAAKALSLKAEGRQPMTGGSAGYRMHDRFHLSSLTLGGLKLTDVPVLSTDNLATTVQDTRKKDPPPILGMDILKNYRVLIDFPGRMMYLQPNVPAAPH
jgi:hypothetical protein